jgi:hypothetical protein
MLLAEFMFVLWTRGITIRGYFEARDPVSGTVYFLTLRAFAVIPMFVGRPRARVRGFNRWVVAFSSTSTGGRTAWFRCVQAIRAALSNRSDSIGIPLTDANRVGLLGAHERLRHLNGSGGA